MRYGLVVGLMLLFSATIVWDLLKTTVVQAAEWNNKINDISCGAMLWWWASCCCSP